MVLVDLVVEVVPVAAVVAVVVVVGFDLVLVDWSISPRLG